MTITHQDHQLPKDRFTNRQYPYERKPRHSRNYSWRTRDAGIVALLCLYHRYKNQIVNSDARAYNNNFADAGLTAKGAWNFLKQVCPDLFEDYKEQTGRLPTANAVIQRTHKWYYNNGPKGVGGKHTQSKEHPEKWKSNFPEHEKEAMRRCQEHRKVT